MKRPPNVLFGFRDGAERGASRQRTESPLHTTTQGHGSRNSCATRRPLRPKVLSHFGEDAGKRAHAEGAVIGDGHMVLSPPLRGQAQVASGLPRDLVAGGSRPVHGAHLVATSGSVPDPSRH